MEFHIPKSSDSQCFQESFDFSPQELADIPCPDDICTPAEGSPQEEDNELLLPPGTSVDDFPDLPLPPGTSGDEFPEILLPPGTSGDDFPISLPSKIPMPLNISNNFSPSLPQNKAIENSSNIPQSESENFNIFPLEDSQHKPGVKVNEIQEDANKQTDFLEESKYSPSKVDSDEENQDFTTIRPKVLGKEQAKKRLMAFSLSKQPSASVKKQNKTVTPAKNKEKPPNPNKGSNVQEQFRATISAIEEEKKKMFQNMPSYLLLEMSELAKSSHSSMSSSIQLLERLKSENAELKSKDGSGKDNSNSSKSVDGKSKRGFRKSRSRSKDKKTRRSRSKRRSRSRTKRSHSRSRRRSYSRSRSRRSREKNYKTDNKNQRESQTVPKKKSFEDWKSFKTAGITVESTESEVSKNRPDESKSRRDKHRRRSRSPNNRSVNDYKPIFNYLNKGCNLMASLHAKPADPGSSNPVFLEKTIKYTRTKPILCWAENPSHATEFYMSKQMLLENCDETTGSFLLSIIENKRAVPLERALISESPSTKTRAWFPRDGHLMSTQLKTHNDLEENVSHPIKKAPDSDYISKDDQSNDKQDHSTDMEDPKKARVSFERKISLVNDSYLSDEEEPVKEVVVGEVKVQLDLDMNRVKVPSRWDSDYEGENTERDSNIHKEETKVETKIKKQTEARPQTKDALIDDFDVAPRREDVHDSPTGKKKSTPLLNLKAPCTESPCLNKSEATTGNLVSEYEEFLKMVSVDSKDDHNNQKEKVSLESKPKVEKSKPKKPEKSNEEDRKRVQSGKLGTTDWDQESDHEEKSNSKKMQFTGSNDEFFILRKDESVDLALEKQKKKPAKKKYEKVKAEKKKFKKSSKAKKKKIEESFSEDDSSSESYESDSDSDSDSDESLSSSKKKKKNSKAKKKSKKDSSSESDSDSDGSKTKKKKQVKKKGKKKKSSSSSDENDEVQTALLKQLDFKKQLIMRKIEEIDSISDKSSKKKEKENREKKKEKESAEETDSDKYVKSGKKKKSEGKVEKDKKKTKYSVKKGKLTGKRKKLKKSRSSSESDSDSESSDESVKKRKIKKTGKRKRYSPDSSDSDTPTKAKSKSSSKASKKVKKVKRDSSSSASDSDNSSREEKVAKKGSKVKSDEKLGKMTDLSFKENSVLDELNLNTEERSNWESKKSGKNPEVRSKKEKEEDDWEASSSVEESEHESRSRESSWDVNIEERETKAPPPEDSTTKTDRMKTPVVPEKELTVNISADTLVATNQLSSEALKTSLSDFSFNENSFCSFGQELSRDFFLADRSYSNSGNINSNEFFKTATLIEPRPFQSVSKDSFVKKPPESELYSPGYSDSDLSESEMSKSEKANSNAESGVREEVYDPLNCDSEGSAENNEIEVSSIPLPHVPDTLLPGETKNFENVTGVSSNSEGAVLKDYPPTRTEVLAPKLSCMTPPVKSSFTSNDFTPVTSQSPFIEETHTPTKRQVMSVRGHQKLISKAASVFQDESDEDNSESVNSKEKISENLQSDISVTVKEKSVDESKGKKPEKLTPKDGKEKEKESGRKRKKSRDRSRERSNERERRRKRSRSRDSRDGHKSYNKKTSSPRRRKSRTPEISREKREIRSDSFEIEPLKSSIDANDPIAMVQPIPVLTGLEAPSSEGLWTRSLISGCEFPHPTDSLIDHAESFDIYPSEESNFRNRNYDKEYADHEKSSVDKSREQKSKKERRKSRSRSYSPRKKLRSKSPERRKSPRNRSPRRKSTSPKRRDKSPFSPRKRSPKRKSPSRRHKISRSPDKRRKSPSRSPRKRRGSPSRRSRSGSPRKYRSPKHREESPRKKDSPGRTFGSRDRFSPRDDVRYSHSYPDGLQNRIPVIGAVKEDMGMELSPSAMRSPFEGPMGFSRHLPDPSAAESEMYGSFYEGEYTDEFGASSYPEEVGVNNLITVKNHDIDKANSPERLSLDQRIELELGVQMTGSQAQGDQYQMPNQSFQEMNSSHFSNSYNCETSNISNDNFYQNQNVQMNTDFNGQYFNGHQQQTQPGYGSFQQYPNSQPAQNSVLQVGNIVEVVPTMQHPPPPPPLPPKTPQIMQVGNVLQVVPSQKAAQSVPSAHTYGPPDASPVVKTQKATAVVAPSSIVPTPNPEAVLNPLIKAIQIEREKRRKEKEKRKAEREARRKARQLRREAKLMSVNEKLKKSVQNEGLMLGQEVEDDELLDGLDVPSPPIPVEIITVSSISALPPAGKGILITAGFMPKPPSEKKEVKFADGVCPGEGTSTSGGEDIASPPPKPKLPKEKRFKKKKTKVKKKVKVQIIRQIIQEDDDDEDDLSPPPPPPGDPPLVFFAKFPFAGDAQFPVYQTHTTTTTLTTVQYPAQTFE